MARRRKPRSLREYLAYTAISLAAAWAAYELRLHFLEQRLEHRLDRAQQQSAKLLSGQHLSAPQTPPRQLSEADVQKMRAEQAARMERARVAQDKQDAWERFYQPPPRCLYPEDSNRAAVCRANELKQHKAFELAWAQQAKP